MSETTAAPQSNESYILVEDELTLNELCATWRDSSFLAMDTEFIRTSTFFPRVGLIQLNAGAGNYLIDPLRISNWDSFCKLMNNQSITKIFHSCSEDLQVFMTAMELLPEPVFDTQIAAAFLNQGFGNSYQSLVQNMLGIDLPKGETRSDWLQRPLAEKQCHYAAQDVAYLPEIYQQLHGALLETGRLEWFMEECNSLRTLYRKELSSDFSDYYLAIRGAWQLDARQLNILKHLAQWREHRARKRDKPRNWIVKDKSLLDIARLAPATLEELGTIDEINANFLHHEGGEILSLIAIASSAADADLPELMPRPLEGKTKTRLRQGQKFIEGKALELNMPVEMLIRKRWLITILQNMRAGESVSAEQDAQALLPEELLGWRYSLLMPGLLQAMTKL